MVILYSIFGILIISKLSGFRGLPYGGFPGSVTRISPGASMADQYPGLSWAMVRRHSMAHEKMLAHKKSIPQKNDTYLSFGKIGPLSIATYFQVDTSSTIVSSYRATISSTSVANFPSSKATSSDIRLQPYTPSLVPPTAHSASHPSYPGSISQYQTPPSVYSSQSQNQGIYLENILYFPN
jgi:hypothetical protein